METKTTRLVRVMDVREAADRLEALAAELRRGSLGLAPDVRPCGCPRR